MIAPFVETNRGALNDPIEVAEDKKPTYEPLVCFSQQWQEKHRTSQLAGSTLSALRSAGAPCLGAIHEKLLSICTQLSYLSEL